MSCFMVNAKFLVDYTQNPFMAKLSSLQKMGPGLHLEVMQATAAAEVNGEA